jgi:hypothetical protein
VAAREQGRLVPGAAAHWAGVIDPFLEKLEELVERSKGKIRADKAHEKITAMGYAGSERTTRRAVAQVKAAWHAGRRRVHRPWIRAGDVGAVRLRRRPADRRGRHGLVLLLAGLVEVPGGHPTAGQVLAVGVGRGRRRAAAGWGLPGLPVDNEKMVTVEHVAGVPVRNPPPWRSAGAG